MFIRIPRASAVTPALNFVACAFCWYVSHQRVVLLLLLSSLAFDCWNLFKCIASIFHFPFLTRCTADRLLVRATLNNSAICAWCVRVVLRTCPISSGTKENASGKPRIQFRYYLNQQIVRSIRSSAKSTKFMCGYYPLKLDEISWQLTYDSWFLYSSHFHGM